MTLALSMPNLRLVSASAVSDNVLLEDCVITDVSAGANHCLALDKDGHIWAWGRNDSGQLGTGDNVDSNTPICILKEHEFKQIAAGKSASFALDKDGFLYTWGNNGGGYVPQKYGDITYKSIILHNLSTQRDYGALRSNEEGLSYNSFSISAQSGREPILIKNESTLVVPNAWGGYGRKTLTFGSDSNPIKDVAGFSYFGSKIAGISGRYYTVENAFFVILRDGSIEYVCDLSYENVNYIDKRNYFSNIDISSLNNIVNVGVGHIDETNKATACFASRDGDIYFVGYNSGYNLFGNEDTISTAYYLNPVKLNSSLKFSKASIGSDFVVALTNDGKLYSWGNNTYGQLGLGHNLNRTTPSSISSLDKLKYFKFVAFANENFEGSFYQNGGSDYTIVQNGTKGEIVLDSNTGDFIYTPLTDSYGKDTAIISTSFSGTTVEYEIEIYIDRKPVFTGGTPNLVLECGQSINGSAPSMDLDDDLLVYSVYSQPSKGHVVLNNNSGSFTYTARNDMAGEDSFVLSVSDGYCEVQFPVSVHINSLITFDDDVDIKIDRNVTNTYNGNVNASDIDGDVLTYSVLTNATKGNVTIDNDGNYTYVAGSSNYGDDSFTIRVNDGYKPLDIVYTVHLFAVSDNGTKLVNKITQGSTFIGQVETLAQGAIPNYSISKDALNGNVEIDEVSGEYIYTPNSGTSGDDSFEVLVDYIYDQYAITIHVYQNTPPNASSVTLNITTNQNTDYLGSAECVDIDGDVLMYSVKTNPSKGSLILDSTTGGFTYSPLLNAAGDDTFSINVNDGTDTITINFSIHIESVISIDENVYHSIRQNTTLVNAIEATDLDGDVLTYSIGSSAGHGIATIDNLTGTYTYIPFTNYYGDDSFAIVVDDGVLPQISTIHIRINQKPIAAKTIINIVTKGITQTGSVDCTDPDGDILTYTLIEDPKKGIVIVDSNTGAFAYTPNVDAAGNDTFKISATDGVDSVIVTINVHNETDVELIEQETHFVVNRGQSINGNVQAIDRDGDELSYFVVNNPQQGALVLSEKEGSWTYTASNNASDLDCFSIKVTDGSSEAVIKYNLTVNNAPVFSEDPYSIITNQNQTYFGQVSASDVDGDLLEYQIVSQPSKGSVTINPSTGEYSYVPNKDAAGDDSFILGAFDGNFTTKVEVKVHIESEITVPSLTILHVIDKNNSVIGNVNASDLDGDLLTYTISQQGTKGDANIQADGSYTYLANKGAGDDFFVVSITDGTHVVYVTVNIHINSDPHFEESSLVITVAKHGEKTGSVNAIDEDCDAITYNISTLPKNGSLTLNSETGDYTYVVFKNSTASNDQFVIFATDGNKVCYATVSVIINQEPEVYGLAFSVKQGDSTTWKITAVDHDLDEITYQLKNDGIHGHVSLNSSTGELVYTTYDKNYNGTDLFVVTVSDGYSTKDVTVNVTIVKNEKPTAYVEPIELDSGTSFSERIITYDGDGNAPTFSISQQGEKGKASINEQTGLFIYSANKDTSGYDCFVITINDGFNEVSVLVEVNINFVDSNKFWAVPAMIAAGSVSLVVIVGSLVIVIRTKKKLKS